MRSASASRSASADRAGSTDGAAREQLRGEPRFRDERLLDARVGLRRIDVANKHAGDEQRDHRRRQRGEEELGLEGSAGTVRRLWPIVIADRELRPAAASSSL